MIHDPNHYSSNVYRCIQFLHIIWKPSLSTRHRLSFCNVKHRLQRRAKRPGAAVSARSLCHIPFFPPVFFCLIVSRYLDDATKQLNKCWRCSKLWGGVGESLYSWKKKCCFDPLVWRIKTYLWKERVCLVSLDSGCFYSVALVLSQSGLHSCSHQSSGAPPLRLRCQRFSYSCHSLILHFPPWPWAVSTFISEELRRAAQPVEQ